MSTPTPETALARRFRIEINMGTDDVPDWQLCPGVIGFNWTAEPNIEDSTEYDTDGWTSNEKTAQSWEAVVSFNRKTDAAQTIYSPVHEAIRHAFFLYGDENKVRLRFYDRNGLPEAYQGKAIPAWEPQNDEATDLDQIEVTFTGDGPLNEIDNPAAAS